MKAGRKISAFFMTVLFCIFGLAICAGILAGYVDIPLMEESFEMACVSVLIVFGIAFFIMRV